MKKLSIVATAVAALVLAGSPAFADNNKNNNDNQGKGQDKQTAIEINGTVKAIVDAKTITVTVKTASQSAGTKTIASAILKAGTVNVTTDTATVIKRGNATTLASVLVGDKVNIRATCTLTPLACKASRITAAAAPTPSPSATAKHLGFTLSGVVVSNTAGALKVVVVKADDGDDNPLVPKQIIGTQFPVATDTATAYTKGSTTISAAEFAALTFPAVSVVGTCTPTTPMACTATRINVLVPTS